MTTRTQEQELDASTSTAPETVIQIDDLRHQYGDRMALNGVSFTVKRAEIFGLLGPNGSGKTTMFRILSTLMLPAAGRASDPGPRRCARPQRRAPPDRRGLPVAQH